MFRRSNTPKNMAPFST